MKEADEVDEADGKFRLKREAREDHPLRELARKPKSIRSRIGEKK
jgi:hypothetical protein